MLCMGLRRCHRAAKRRLIEISVDKAVGQMCNARILDLACGRGGDLPKCLGCAKYTGVDTAADALAELHRRAEEMSMLVSTIHGDASQVVITNEYDLVMCNFALHYFCDTKEHCHCLVRAAAKSLKYGGVWCGTYQRWPTKPRWGEQHHVKMGDCVDAIEWKVPWPEIQKEALHNDMALVMHQPLCTLHPGADSSIWFFITQKQAQRCGS